MVDYIYCILCYLFFKYFLVNLINYSSEGEHIYGMQQTDLYKQML